MISYLPLDEHKRVDIPKLPVFNNRPSLAQKRNLDGKMSPTGTKT
jgi:hypothetical protein